MLEEDTIEANPMHIGAHKGYDRLEIEGNTDENRLHRHRQASRFYDQTELTKLSQELCNRSHPCVFGMMISFFLCCVPLILLVAITESSVTYKTINNSGALYSQYEIKANKAAVSTDNADCSTIGNNFLQQGGNAADAAIASTLCLGVISPGSSGIGGGCHILVYQKSSGLKMFIDARERAPAAANSTMFTNDPLSAQNGALGVAVFGELRGLYELYTSYSSQRFTWSELVEPAAKLAAEWTISGETESYLDVIEPYLLSDDYPELSSYYVSHGKVKRSGDIVKQPKLSYTLTQIGKYGPDYLYKTMAATVAEELQALGGIITEDDINNYSVDLLPPIETEVLGYTYLGASGSSSGGSVVAGILKFMESYDQPMASLGLLYNQRLAEAFKHAFAIRMSLGDPLYVNSTGPISALLSDEFMESLQKVTSDDSCLPMEMYGGKYNCHYAASMDSGTTHLSILDSDGMAVAITSTINTEYGSKVVSPSTGILLNNQMDDFSIPGSANYFHLSPSPLNYPAPFKKPLSSMSPSILLDSNSGEVKLIGGASGGPRIITATAQVILNVIARGMDLLSAVVAPRLHNQLFPEKVDLEYEHQIRYGTSTITTTQQVFQDLVDRGQNATMYDSGMGVTQFVVLQDGEITAVADPRKGGLPKGF